MKYLAPKFEEIPKSLQGDDRWVVWTTRDTERGPTKPPINVNDFDPRNPREAASNRPQEWGSFYRARCVYEWCLSHKTAKPIHGVGRMFAPDDGLVGIDVDKCRDPTSGVLEPYAKDILELLNSYSEISPSGTGLRIYVRGSRPASADFYKKNPKNKIECYCEGRYLTLTGHRFVRFPAEPMERQKELEQFVERYMRRPKQEATTERKEAGAIPDADKLLSIARGNDKFRRLFDEGDLSFHNGDRSSADMALCCLLAYYCGCDPEAMDALFRQSKLYRDKWERDDYRERTIEAAIANCGSTFSYEAHERVQATANLRKKEEEAFDLIAQSTPLPELEEPLPLPAKKESIVGSPYRFRPLAGSAFLKRTYSVEWLIKGMIAKGQPCILGGAKKSLKTTLLEDMAISLGSGTPFLGTFPTTKARTVLISGESGEYTIQETAKRICVAKGVRGETLETLWDFRLPRLSVPQELNELSKGLDEHGIQVCLLDPLYLCLLAGNPEKQASNLFDVGPLLLSVAQACLSVGCTPILAHHTKKNLNNPYMALDLEDLAFAGVQEFARQWLLVSRREAYVPGTGIHKLWLTYGGSVGHGGTKALDINEGMLDDDFGGRKWEVKVQSVFDMKKLKAEAKEAESREAIAELEAAVLEVLATEGQWTKNKLINGLGWGHEKAERVLDGLLSKAVIVPAQESVTLGSGAQRMLTTYHTAEPAEPFC